MLLKCLHAIFPLPSSLFPLHQIHKLIVDEMLHQEWRRHNLGIDQIGKLVVDGMLHGECMRSQPTRHYFVHIEESKRSRASLRLQKRSESTSEKSTRATNCGNDKRPYHNMRTNKQSSDCSPRGRRGGPLAYCAQRASDDDTPHSWHSTKAVLVLFVSLHDWGI